MITENAQKLIGYTAHAELTPWTEMRDERRHQNTFEQLGKVGLYKLLRAPLAWWIHSLGPYELIGSGGQNIVLHDISNDNVLKLLISTIATTWEEVQRLCGYYQTMVETSKQYLTDHSAETAFYPVRLSFPLGRYAVGALQTLVKPQASFPDADSVLTHEITPGFMTELGSLTASIQNLHRNTGMYPDLLGPNNIMLVDKADRQRLQIVDTIPETPEKLREIDPQSNTTRREAIANIIARWELALST